MELARWKSSWNFRAGILWEFSWQGSIILYRIFFSRRTILITDCERSQWRKWILKRLNSHFTNLGRQFKCFITATLKKSLTSFKKNVCKSLSLFQLRRIPPPSFLFKPFNIIYITQKLAKLVSRNFVTFTKIYLATVI